MSWGAMGGLGEGLAQVGQMFGDISKAKLADDLERKREEARESRAEARELKKIVGEPVLKGDTWEYYNKNGAVVKSTKATADELAEVADAKRLRELDLRGKAADVTTKEVTAADAPASVERKIAEHKSSLASAEESRRASRDASARGWKGLELEGERNRISEKGLAAKFSGADDEASVDVVQDLRKQLGTQIGQLQQEYGLSVSDMNNAIMGAYQEALATSKRTGKKPSEWLNGTVFVDNLNRYLKRRAQ